MAKIINFSIRCIAMTMAHAMERHEQKKNNVHRNCKIMKEKKEIETIAFKLILKMNRMTGIQK